MVNIVVGAALLGIKASGESSDRLEIMVKLGWAGSTVLPNNDQVAKITPTLAAIKEAFVAMSKGLISNNNKKYHGMMA